MCGKSYYHDYDGCAVGLHAEELSQLKWFGRIVKLSTFNPHVFYLRLLGPLGIRHGYEAGGYEAEAKPKLWPDHEAEAEAEAEALPFLIMKPKPNLKPRCLAAIKRLLFYLIHLIFTEIQATCAGQNGLKVKTVDIFSFRDHKGKVENLSFSDHEAEAFVKTRSWSWSRSWSRSWSFHFLKSRSWSRSRSFSLKSFGFMKPKLNPKQLRTHVC